MTGVTVKLMARGVFSGELNPDPESAAADLRRAGYEVFHDAGQSARFFLQVYWSDIPTRSARDLRQGPSRLLALPRRSGDRQRL